MDRFAGHHGPNVELLHIGRDDLPQDVPEGAIADLGVITDFLTGIGDQLAGRRVVDRRRERPPKDLGPEVIVAELLAFGVDPLDPETLRRAAVIPVTITSCETSTRRRVR